MKSIDASKEIERLICFAIKQNVMDEMDSCLVRNYLLDLFNINEPYEGEDIGDIPESPVPILERLKDYAAYSGMLKDNTIAQRDLLDSKIMGIVMPKESEVVRRFNYKAEHEGIESATDDFYHLSKCSNYIMTERIAKNIYWQTKTNYGDLEITINLSKPEKDPKDIAAAKKVPQTNYPKCLLCVENVGYAGNLNHPGRQNHRVIPVAISGEKWYFQYSPYVYYNEHSILFYEKHVPMKISHKTFARLMDFIDKFPHYFIGSNADLPIVGGSILNHEHFQGGRHVFPMEKASVLKRYKHEDFKNVGIGIVEWPMSVIRLWGDDKEAIIKLASLILDKWRDYSDESLDILAYTKEDGEAISHNTITPIARKNASGEYELDLVLRNNRTTDEYPLGIFHPHERLHHIKKENIGLIEVMGLAVLPGRLSYELSLIEDILTGEDEYSKAKLEDESNPLYKHREWIYDMVNIYGRCNDLQKAKDILKKEVGEKFLEVLLDAGVYKRNKEGMDGFNRFMESLGFK
jgi:UDPglucose--hexose-1-phosphate uridylyltransferase